MTFSCSLVPANTHAKTHTYRRRKCNFKGSVLGVETNGIQMTLQLNKMGFYPRSTVWSDAQDFLVDP